MNHIANIASTIAGGFLSVCIGFLPKTYEHYTTKELLVPMYLGVAMLLVLKGIREKFILPRVDLIYQHGTLVGIESKHGKEVFVGMYNAHELLTSFIVGMFICWNFVILASM